MRKNIVAGNWKMNMDYEQGISLFSEIVNMVKDEVIGNQEIVVCSPFIHLAAISKLSAHTNNVSIGAQTINQHESGAYTGEISASQVKSTGAEYCDFRAFQSVVLILVKQMSYWLRKLMRL
ncbi:Triosephosphate isomerase [Sphingobacterium daejeonense]|nr:triose-phosphate isomerase [Sphingobacterium daejeonense]VTP99410.1 Triosephosphate isomerase [Sphingobacterium daejeonense]